MLGRLTLDALYIDKWVPLVLGLGVRGLKKKKKKKKTRFVQNQIKAVLMDHLSALNFLNFEPLVLLSVLLFFNIDRGHT